MNIVEATKSGLPFRRKTNFSWMVVPKDSKTVLDVFSGWKAVLTVEDLLADDYEVKKVVEITSEQFWKACQEYVDGLEDVDGDTSNIKSPSWWFMNIAKKLGLE